MMTLTRSGIWKHQRDKAAITNMLQQIRANVHETNGKRNKDRQFQQRFKRYKEESEELDMTWRLKKNRSQLQTADG